MTREEAITVLKNLVTPPFRKDGKSTLHLMVNMAIDSLEADSQRAYEQGVKDALDKYDETCRIASDIRCAMGCKTAKECRDLISNGEIQRVKHGRWIPCTKTGMPLTEYGRCQGEKWFGYKCSECNTIYKGNALTESPYCQRCGAIMDESTMGQTKPTKAVSKGVKGKMREFEAIVEQPKPIRNGVRFGEEILKMQFVGTEIVRCKDCKWYKEGKYFAPVKFCFRLKDRDGEEIGYNFASDDFCSYGERKDEVENEDR